jgi:hypothetical protein
MIWIINLFTIIEKDFSLPLSFKTIKFYDSLSLIVLIILDLFSLIFFCHLSLLSAMLLISNADTKKRWGHVVFSRFNAARGFSQRALLYTLKDNRDRALNPWLITGFTDGEGCFLIDITENKNYSTGWKVQARFKIELHQKDIAVLELLKNFFKGTGSITKAREDSLQFRVNSIKDLNIIIDHFVRSKISFDYSKESWPAPRSGAVQHAATRLRRIYFI